MNWLNQLKKTLLLISISVILLELSSPGVHDTLNIFITSSLVIKPTKSKDPNAIIWKDYKVDINKEFILSNNLIQKVINDFWINEVNKILDNQHIIVLFRIITNDNSFYTIGHLQSLNKNDKDWYIEYINDILSLKSEEYREYLLNYIVFSYGVREGIETQDKLFFILIHVLNCKIILTSKITHFVIFFFYFDIPFLLKEDGKFYSY